MAHAESLYVATHEWIHGVIMDRYSWTVEILTDTGRWVPHWTENTRNKARKVAMHLYGAVRRTRITRIKHY